MMKSFFDHFLDSNKITQRFRKEVKRFTEVSVKILKEMAKSQKCNQEEEKQVKEILTKNSNNGGVLQKFCMV